MVRCEVHQKNKDGIMPDFPCWDPGLEKMKNLYSTREDGERIITEGGNKAYPRIRIVRDAKTYRIIQRDYWMSLPRKYRGFKSGMVFQYTDGPKKDRYDFLSASGGNFQTLYSLIEKEKGRMVGVICGISKKFSKEISDFLEDNWNKEKVYKTGSDIDLSEVLAHVAKKQK